MLLLRQLYLLAQYFLLSGFMISVDIPELLIGSTAVNWLLNEQRPVSTVVADVAITSHINYTLSKDSRYRNSSVAPVSYNCIVLLVGQVENEALKEKAYLYATKTPQVKAVFNQLSIGRPIPAWQLIKDIWISLNMHVQVITTSQLNYHHFRVKVENGEVFILGKTNPRQATLVGTTAQKIKGVKRVVKLIEESST